MTEQVPATAPTPAHIDRTPRRRQPKATSVLFDVPGPQGRRRNVIIGVVGSAVLLILAAALLYGLRDQLFVAAAWLRFANPTTWTFNVIPGLINTAQAAVIAIVTATVLGLILGTGRLSGFAPVRWLAGVLTEFFRAVPVLMMMLFFYYLFQNTGLLTGYVLPLVSVVLGLTLYNGSVIAELIRSGVRSLPKGQAEAGLAVGMTPGQVLRSIQLPQAITAMLPSLLSQIVVVIKDTALGYIITYPDLLTSMRRIASSGTGVLATLLVAAVFYIVINYAITSLAGFIEVRLRQRRGTRAVTAAPVQGPGPGPGPGPGG